jgi:hypothetical protein
MGSLADSDKGTKARRDFIARQIAELRKTG